MFEDEMLPSWMWCDLIDQGHYPVMSFPIDLYSARVGLLTLSIGMQYIIKVCLIQIKTNHYTQFTEQKKVEILALSRHPTIALSGIKLNT